MSDWISIENWARCQEMARPGVYFELRNAEGQSLFSLCQPSVPAAPFDWRSPPIAFRAVPEPVARPSAPIPPPAAPGRSAD